MNNKADALYNTSDRYKASGKRYPKHPCKNCEGMGFTPTMDSVVLCLTCGATGDSRAKPIETDVEADW